MIDLRSAVKSGRPNQYLVAPDGYLAGETADEVSPVFSRSPAEVLRATVALLETRSGLEDLRVDEAAGRIAYVARVFIFKDDVDIAVTQDAEGAALAVFSRSRVGHSDLGVNRRRVKALLSDLSDALGEPARP
jgi:uncharacterized protein (DUF1499 family)